MPEIASAFVSLLPSAKGFGRRMESEVGGEVKGAGKRLGSGFGKAFALAGGALAAAGIGSFLKDAVDQASDLEESTTKISAIFGNAAGAVQKFAGKGATALGQTRLEVLNAAANFGTFGKAAGLAGRPLAKFSTGFAGLSTDLASFYNSSPETAVEAIGAALRGEAEPIRQFGVLLDDATLRNEALRLGLIKTTKDALTPQQKVLAAQAAIYKQTKDAQGDFQRTSGGLANQQRILSAQWSDMKTQLGARLLPVVTRAVTALNANLGPAITKVAALFNRAQTFLAPFVAKIGVAFGQARAYLEPFIQQVRTFFNGEGRSAIQGFATQVVTFFQANVLPVLQTAANTFRTVVLPAVVAFATYVGTALIPVVQDIANVVLTRVVPILKSFALFVYGTLYPAIVGVATAVARNLKPVFDQLVETFRAKLLPTLDRALATFQKYQPAIQRVIAVVVKVIGKLLQFAAAILGKVLPPAIRLSAFLSGTMVSAMIKVVGAVAGAIRKIVEFGGAVVGAVKKAAEFQRGVAEKVAKVVTYFEKLPGKIKGAIGNAASMLYETGRNIVAGLISGIWSKAGDLVQAIQDAVTDKIPGFVKKAMGIESPSKVMAELGAFMIQGLTLGMGRQAAKDDSKIAGVVKKLLAKGADRDFIEGLSKNLVIDWAKVVGLKGKNAENAFDQMRDRLTKALDKMRSGLQKQIDSVKSTLDSMKSFASSVSSAFKVDLFSGSLTDFFTNGLTNNATLKAVIAGFKKLVKGGFNKGFLSSLIQSGNAGLILELANADAATVQQAQSIYGQQNSLTSQLGTFAAEFNSGKTFKGVEDRLDKLNDKMRDLPKDIGAAVGKSLRNEAVKGKRNQPKGKK